MPPDWRFLLDRGVNFRTKLYCSRWWSGLARIMLRQCGSCSTLKISSGAWLMEDERLDNQ